MADMQDSTPNWPVVGGIYAVKTDPNNIRLRVTSIEIDGPTQRVAALFVKNDGSEDSIPITCYVQSFREITLSGYQSPVPALVAALKAILGNIDAAHAALALAGETGVEEKHGSSD